MQFTSNFKREKNVFIFQGSPLYIGLLAKQSIKANCFQNKKKRPTSIISVLAQVFHPTFPGLTLPGPCF